MIQLALFPRPVEPEDVEADVRGDPWADRVGLRLSHLPTCLWACNTFGGMA